MQWSRVPNVTVNFATLWCQLHSEHADNSRDIDASSISTEVALIAQLGTGNQRLFHRCTRMYGGGIK
jgi:hypothetical protein